MKIENRKNGTLLLLPLLKLFGIIASTILRMGGNMSVLVFWKGDIYYRDMKLSGKSYEFNQNNRRILNIAKGQHVWTFTRREDKTYVLASDLIAISTQINQPKTPGYFYGKYKVTGDKKSSRYFDIELGKDVEHVIRSLSFQPQAFILGRSFRGKNGVRELTSADEQKLTTFASRLTTI